MHKKIMNIYNFFTEHPKKVCMDYLEHLNFSLKISNSLFKGSVKALIHSFLPKYYETSTTNLVEELKSEIINSGCDAKKNSRILVLFDVDGTLTEPRQKVSDEMLHFLDLLKKRVSVGIVGGSDLIKQKEQMGANIINEVNYSFSENGLVAYKDGLLIGTTKINDYLGEENIKNIINFSLDYISKLNIPIKRGTFIEYRSGMLNISPIGRNCSLEERNEFEKYDSANNIRKEFIEALKKKFNNLSLNYSIGGQISFDLFPEGWDKTYCLKYLDKSDYDKIYFFGDKTYEGGNDYEIFSNERIIGFNTKNPEHTIEQCNKLFFN